MNGTSSRGIPFVLAGLSIISTVAGWSIPIVITLGIVGKIPWWWTPVAVLLSGPVVWLAMALTYLTHRTSSALENLHNPNLGT